MVLDVVERFLDGVFAAVCGEDLGRAEVGVGDDDEVAGVLGGLVDLVEVFRPGERAVGGEVDGEVRAEAFGLAAGELLEPREGLGLGFDAALEL